MHIAFEPHVLAVLVHPGGVGNQQRRLIAVVGDARIENLGAVVVGEMDHALRHDGVLQQAGSIEATYLEILDDVVGIMPALAVAHAADLRRLFEPEGQGGERTEQRHREERRAAASHFR